MDVTVNYSTLTCVDDPGSNCSSFNINLTEVMNGQPTAQLSIVKAGSQFYAYFTPVILFVGLLGNVLSLLVFLSKNMRGMSASRYLAALSLADLCTLVFYVFCEWLLRGLVFITPGVKVTFLAIEGVCQAWLYFNYLSRFLSAWLTVCFTFERFVGVCMPFRRRHMGSLKGTMRIITSLVVTSAVLVAYKPFMSGVHTIHGETRCTSLQNLMHQSFIIDSIYALSITLIPFCIIAVLNTLIIRRLYYRSRRHRDNLITDESHTRLEFTLILLAISFFLLPSICPISSVPDFYPFHHDGQRHFW